MPSRTYGLRSIRYTFLRIASSPLMSRYQLELAEMDRGHFWRIRILSVSGAAVLIALAMWSAGIPNASWFSWVLNPESESSSGVSSSANERKYEARAPENAPVAVPRTLRLVSTAPGRNVREGTAQITIGPSNPLTYGAGALLEDGAEIREIHADHVILEREGEVTSLYIDGIAHSATSAEPRRLHLRRVEEKPVLAAVTVPASPNFTEIVRSAPRFENDQIIGFDVYPGTSSGQFHRLGLQSGDVLISIDGAPITSQDALRAALKDIAEGRSVVATVRRAESEIPLSIDGSALSSQPALAGAQPGEHWIN